MTKKHLYLKALRNCSSEWIFASAKNPNSYMTKIDILLHYVILRERGLV